MDLQGKVCIVTGASRGIGKGIALQLGEHGATVYITGRTLISKPGIKGSLQETANQIEARGGKCIPVQCDHSHDKDVEELFKRVEKEQNGRLDLLVNNAYNAFHDDTMNMHKKFYELSLDYWDSVNRVGLRNHYICSVYAARLMAAQKHGLIIWISSAGARRYFLSTAYGVGKAGCDKMAENCGHELREKNIACISLWPGLVKTENVSEIVHDLADNRRQHLGGELFAQRFETAESIEYSGKVVVTLMKEKDIMGRTGKVVTTAEIGNQYDILDINGRKPQSFSMARDMSGNSKL